MIERAQIVEAARSWLGTRWHHQASLKRVGTDCIGFVVGVARECGVAEASAWDSDPVRKCYGREPDPNMLLTACDRYLERVEGEPGLGDVLLFRRDSDHKPQHFGIVSALNPPYVIHAYAQARRVVEHGLDELWRARIVRAYRFRGVS